MPAGLSHYQELTRRGRELGLRYDPPLQLLHGPDREAFLNGECQIRLYHDTLIIDYTRPWGTEALPENLRERTVANIEQELGMR